MLIQNLRTYLKHLKRNPFYSAVTIFGFATSLAFIILLSIYINKETSVDDFHINKERIYRLTHERNSGFPPIIAEELKEKYPEIENYTRIHHSEKLISGNDVENENRRIKCLMADSAFFQIFSFKLKEGNRQMVLKTANSIVLSLSLSRDLFGNDSPLGQEVIIDKYYHFTVTGVMEDFPKNTHFKHCDAILNFKSIKQMTGGFPILKSKRPCSYAIYFLAREKSNLSARTKEILASFKKDFWIYKNEHVKQLSFEPLKEVYFSDSTSNGSHQQSRLLLTVLYGIVMLILAIAIINYINMTVAQAASRNKEIVIKKIIGSGKSRLFLQFIFESILLCLVAFVFSLMVTLAIKPIFSEMLNTTIDLKTELNISSFSFSVLIIMLIGTISGIIPAIIITRQNPVEVLKGAAGRKNSSLYAKILISLQFCIAILLIICASIIWKQTKYIQNFNLGFKEDNILWIKYDIGRQLKYSFKDQLLSLPGVEEVAFAAGSPIDGGNNNTTTYNDKPISFQRFKLDSAFMNMFEIKTTPTGSAYSKDAILLNQEAVKRMELDSLPTQVKLFNKQYQIYGVVKNFHFKDLHEKIGPAIIDQMQPNDYPWKIFVKISGKNQKSIVKQIQEMHYQITNGVPMKFGFVDEKIDQWYQKDKNTSSIVNCFTILSVILSVMGILAMSIYYLKQRIKEIGIRKANGATVRQLVIMLNIDFLKWILLAFIIASPIGYQIMKNWLNNFAYTTEISWGIFALAGIIALGVGWATISWQTYKTASQDPSKALKYE